VFMTFMLVPVLAPNIGQAILLVASWRAIFLVLGAYALAMLVWAWLRLPETLHPEYRQSLEWRPIGRAVMLSLREPQSRGYTFALTLSFAALVAYISSIQQIIFDVFGEGRHIGLTFAAIAAPMALASWANSKVVGRFGLRRVGHGAALVFALITAAHAALALAGDETFASFIVLQALAMASFAFASSNLGTLAMEHMAPIAGTASSVQGVVSTLGAAAIGFAIGQAFDGTVIPYLAGVAGCGALSFVIVMLTEPKRLFAPISVERGATLEPCMPEDLA
jgi:MFS transporter, DHA1 family, multidrug resistance protein